MNLGSTPSHGYGQKAVELSLGIHRIVEGLSGASYHRAFQDFLTSGCLKPLIYNVEDAVGCLKILKSLDRDPISSTPLILLNDWEM